VPGEIELTNYAVALRDRLLCTVRLLAYCPIRQAIGGATISDLFPARSCVVRAEAPNTSTSPPQKLPNDVFPGDELALPLYQQDQQFHRLVFQLHAATVKA
jgi:hypothetical protein